jgi:hypothetical protein
MHDILKILVEQGVPTDSHVAAGVHCNQTELSEPQYRRMLGELMNEDLTPFDDVLRAKLTYAYFCQEMVKIHLGRSGMVNLEDLYPHVVACAEKIITKNPWMWVSADEPSTDASGNVTISTGKKKKGWKRDAAELIYTELKDSGTNAKKTIMDRFMTELDMSKQGATSYFHASKNKLG